jgi:two-component system response regulator FixJ
VGQPTSVERTVYVLDDDEAVLRSLERLLSSANFEPVMFESPDVFVTATKTFKTGCVLLDVRLPGMSGLDVQLQLNRMRSDLPVIGMSGQGDIQIAVRALKAGASDFLEKPYSEHALLGRSRPHLRKKTAPGVIAISLRPSGASQPSVRASATFLTG